MAVQRHVEAHKLGEVFFAPLDVVLDETNVVQPDIIFVATASAGILDRRGVMGAPDLAVEIISPTSLRRDRYDKRELYARFGVKEFWLADVANQSIEVLSLQESAYRLLCCATPEGRVRSEVLPGFETRGGVAGLSPWRGPIRAERLLDVRGGEEADNRNTERYGQTRT